MRAGQLQLLFDAGSFEELDRLPKAYLRPGSSFVLNMQLNAPVAKMFDLAGAELLFRPVTPPGLDLIDVRSDGWSRVVVEMRVRADVAEAGAAQATMAAWPLLAAVGLFIKTHWIGLSLVAIGIAATLGLLVTAIRGFGELVRVMDRTIILVAVAAAAVIGVTLVRRWRET